MNAWEFPSDHQEERMELLAFRPKTADTDGEDSSSPSRWLWDPGMGPIFVGDSKIENQVCNPP